MAIRWNERDLLRITRDCDLGLVGEQLHVVAVDGPYMTARHSGGLFVCTGRDYAHAVKVGEAAVDGRDKPPGDLRDRVRRVIVEMRDRNGNILAGNPQLGEVIEKIARAVERND